MVAPDQPTTSSAAGTRVAVLTELWLDQPPRHPGLSIYGPQPSLRPRFFEVAAADSEVPAAGLYAFLGAMGCKAAVTRPGAEFVTNRLLRAYLAPLTRYLLRGGAPATVARSLCQFGFVRGPAEVLRDLQPVAAAHLVANDGAELGQVSSVLAALVEARAGEGENEPALGRALSISLLAEVTALLQDSELTHPALVDLMAREVLDFPLEHGSLCQYLSPARVRELLDGNSLDVLLPDPLLAEADRYVSQGRAILL
jgi:hypothetical protein